MKRAIYAGKGQDTVPTGFLNPSSSQVLAASGTTTAFAADTVVRVTATAGTAWIAIGTAPTAAANTSGSHPVVAQEDFNISSGDKINSTEPLCVTPFE